MMKAQGPPAFATTEMTAKMPAAKFRTAAPTTTVGAAAATATQGLGAA